MNYLEAVHAKRVLKKYRELSTRYWDAMGADNIQDQKVLRRQVAERINAATQAAKDVGSPISISQQSPTAGGIINLNVFELVLDEYRKQFPIGKTNIIGYLDRAVGAATEAKRKALYRLILPWYLMIDIAALVLSIPFLIFRKAGLPPSIEEKVWAQIISAVILIGTALYLAGKGLNVSLTDLLAFFAK